MVFFILFLFHANDNIWCLQTERSFGNSEYCQCVCVSFQHEKVIKYPPKYLLPPQTQSKHLKSLLGPAKSVRVSIYVWVSEWVYMCFISSGHWGWPPCRWRAGPLWFRRGSGRGRADPLGRRGSLASRGRWGTGSPRVPSPWPLCDLRCWA